MEEFKKTDYDDLEEFITIEDGGYYFDDPDGLLYIKYYDDPDNLGINEVCLAEFKDYDEAKAFFEDKFGLQIKFR